MGALEAWLPFRASMELQMPGKDTPPRPPSPSHSPSLGLPELGEEPREEREIRENHIG